MKQVERLRDCKTLAKLAVLGEGKAGVDLCKRVDEAVILLEGALQGLKQIARGIPGPHLYATEVLIALGVER